MDFFILQCIAINNKKESSKILLGIAVASSLSSEVTQHCHGHLLIVGIGLFFTMSNSKSFINNYCTNRNMSLSLLGFIVCQFIELIFSFSEVLKREWIESVFLHYQFISACR